MKSSVQKLYDAIRHELRGNGITYQLCELEIDNLAEALTTVASDATVAIMQDTLGWHDTRPKIPCCKTN